MSAQNEAPNSVNEESAESSYSASQDLFDETMDTDQISPETTCNLIEAEGETSHETEAETSHNSKTDQISPEKTLNLNDTKCETSHSSETSPSILNFDKLSDISTSPVKSETGTPTHRKADMRAFWRGWSLSEMYTSLRLKPIRPSASGERHIVCVEFGKYKAGSVPLAHPASIRPGLDKWDSHHVRMPFSAENMYPVTLDSGEKDLKKRWSVIEDALSFPIMTSHDLETCMKKYNGSNWDFRGLHQYFDEVDDEEELDMFFKRLFPEMTELLRRSPSLVTTPLPLLKQNRSASITLSQQQVCALLVNAFFCTFPRRNTTRRYKEKEHEYENYPDINFNRLYSNFIKDIQPEKLKCLFNYFRRVLVTDELPKGLITYTRKSMTRENLPRWSNSSSKLGKVHINSQGTIEDGEGMLQADFANSFVGGGVLGQGCVQEEIRFLTCPELILSRLFTERLGDLEVLFITGFECFSKHTGYGQSFKFDGSFVDKTKVEFTPSGPRRLSYLVAMDALHFHNPLKQYTKYSIDRELNKAFVAFNTDLEVLDDISKPVCVATGNWGCGAFRGDPQLKSLIQMIAASVCRRDLVYYTFSDENLRDSIGDIYAYLNERSLTVGQLYELLLSYGKLVEKSAANRNLSLFDFLYQEIESYNLDTASEEDDTTENKSAETSKAAKRKLVQESAVEVKPSNPITAERDFVSQGARPKQPPGIKVKLSYGNFPKDRVVSDESDFPDLGTNLKHSPTHRPTSTKDSNSETQRETGLCKLEKSYASAASSSPKSSSKVTKTDQPKKDQVKITSFFQPKPQ